MCVSVCVCACVSVYVCVCVCVCVYLVYMTQPGGRDGGQVSVAGIVGGHGGHHATLTWLALLPLGYVHGVPKLA